MSWIKEERGERDAFLLPLYHDSAATNDTRSTPVLGLESSSSYEEDVGTIERASKRRKFLSSVGVDSDSDDDGDSTISEESSAEPIRSQNQALNDFMAKSGESALVEQDSDETETETDGDTTISEESTTISEESTAEPDRSQNHALNEFMATSGESTLPMQLSDGTTEVSFDLQSFHRAEMLMDGTTEFELDSVRSIVRRGQLSPISDELAEALHKQLNIALKDKLHDEEETHRVMTETKRNFPSSDVNFQSNKVGKVMAYFGVPGDWSHKNIWLRSQKFSEFGVSVRHCHLKLWLQNRNVRLFDAVFPGSKHYRVYNEDEDAVIRNALKPIAQLPVEKSLPKGTFEGLLKDCLQTIAIPRGLFYRVIVSFSLVLRMVNTIVYI